MSSAVSDRSPINDMTGKTSVSLSPSSVHGAKNDVRAMSKLRIVKNLFVVCSAYCMGYTGFWALTNLQSTMNDAGGVGPDSQAVIYGCALLSCPFLPELLIGKIGSKKTFVFTLLAILPYIASNFYPHWSTMIPAAVLCGLALAPAGATQALYVNELATRYTAASGGNLENVLATFSGVFLFSVESTQVFGNTISFYALSEGNHTQPPENVSVDSECGIHFQPDGTNANMIPPSDSSRYLLVGIFVLMGFLAVCVMALFADPLNEEAANEGGFELFFSALKFLKNPQLLLLIPIAIFCGMESVFYANEYTQAYIACSWGIHHVGFVTICYGVCGALMGVLVGPLVKCVSQMSVLILAACINITTCALLYVWQPTPDVPIIYFAFAGVWGMGDAIWWSQVAALYGLMFPNDREAAFSNYFFWSFLGFFISYSYANYFSVAVKINILLSVLIVGMIGYLAGQIKLKCSAKREYISLPSDEINGS